jgi:hypothetical protein
MTRLRQLHITSTQGSSQISNFLALITVPATTNIQIRCIARLGRGATAAGKVSAFTSSLHSLIQTMHIEDDGFDGCCYKSVWVCLTDHGLKIAASRSDIETDQLAMDFQLTIECGCTPEDTLRKILPCSSTRQDPVIEIGYWPSQRNPCSNFLTPYPACATSYLYARACQISSQSLR